MYISTGTAIWVFAVVPNTLPNTNPSQTNVNITFSLDEKVQQPYQHLPDTSNAYLYNVPVYTKQGLDNIEHKLLIAPTAGINNSVFVFDYAIYTYVPNALAINLSHDQMCSRFDDTPTSSSSLSTQSSTSTSTTSSSTGYHKSPVPIGAIAGGTVGGLVAIFLALLALLCYMRRGRRNDGDRIRHVEDKPVLDPEDALATPDPFIITDMHRSDTHLLGPSPKPLRTPVPHPSSDVSQSRSMSSNSAAAPRTNKLLMRQTELQQQLNAARSHLNSAESVAPSGDFSSLDPPSSSSHNDEISPEERALQERVQALEAEINRIRAESAAPPAYEVGRGPSQSQDPSIAVQASQNGQALGGAVDETLFGSSTKR
jgi:hypothetical protein